MAHLNPQRNHYLLANLEQYELLNLIRKTTDNHEIIHWEMLGLNNIYTEHTAGPISAGKLGINEGEIIGYSTPSGGGHQKGGAIGDAEIEEPNQPPPIKGIIGTMR